MRKHLKRKHLTQKLQKSLSREFDFSKEAFRLSGQIGIPLEVTRPSIKEFANEIIDFDGMKKMMDPSFERGSEFLEDLKKDLDRFKIAAGVSLYSIDDIWQKFKTWKDKANVDKDFDSTWGTIMYYPRIEHLQKAIDAIKNPKDATGKVSTVDRAKMILSVIANVGKTMIKAALVKLALAAAKYAICTFFPLPGTTIICAIYDAIKEHVKFSFKILDEDQKPDLLANKNISYSTRPMCRIDYSDDLVKIEDLGFQMPANPLKQNKEIENEMGVLQYKIAFDFEGKRLQEVLNHPTVQEALQKYRDFSDAVGKVVTKGKEVAFEYGAKVVAAAKSGFEKMKEKIGSLAENAKNKIKGWFGWRFKKNIKNLRLKKFKVNSKARLQQQLSAGYEMLLFWTNGDQQLYDETKQMFKEQLYAKNRKYV